ncbi:putative mitochondrial protein AtMg01250 [Bidens hawaiensis]|uniref:putative mitochondrial protein AtMg01250 n=1 Tax=Bidens hawaiensis TaxID=980011 RepID=UPI0040491034
MGQMGFPEVWCNWILGILSSARSSVLVNGSLTFEFRCSKGMREGNPISLFLFLIVMEAFSNMITKAIEVGLFKGVQTPRRGPVVSHLLYADDAMIMGEWSKLNIENVMRILRCFHIFSGLKINIHKSYLFGYKVSGAELSSMAGQIGCNIGVVPFKHLGILVGANMNNSNNWNGIVDIFKK